MHLVRAILVLIFVCSGMALGLAAAGDGALNRTTALFFGSVFAVSLAAQWVDHLYHEATGDYLLDIGWLADREDGDGDRGGVPGAASPWGASDPDLDGAVETNRTDATRVTVGDLAAVEGVTRRPDRTDPLEPGAVAEVARRTPTPTTGRAVFAGADGHDGDGDGRTFTSPAGQSGVVLAVTVVDRPSPAHVPEEWVTVGVAVEARDFRVADETGTVRVEIPDGVAVGREASGTVTAGDACYSLPYWTVAGVSPAGETPPDRVVRVTERAGVDPTDERLRCREATLSPGDPVIVLGDVVESYAETTLVPEGRDPDGRFLVSTDD